MDSEQKRRILDAHMHLPTQGVPLSEEKKIPLKEVQKNGTGEGIVISGSAITNEIGSLKGCLELFPDIYYVHIVDGISPLFNYEEQRKLLDTVLSEKKIVGIKLFCGHELLYLPGNILESVYALTETYNVPMLFHPERDSSQYVSYLAVCEAVRQRPSITFVCCHCHYPDVEACLQRCKDVNNIMFDISSIADVQTTADMRRATQSELQGHPDAIMFGSDYAGCSQADHLESVMSLAVPDDIQSRLLYKTVYRVFHLAQEDETLYKFMNIYSHISIHTAYVCSYPLWWPDNSCSCIQYIQLFLYHWMICMQNSPFFADLQQREFLFSVVYSIIPVVEC